MNSEKIGYLSQSLKLGTFPKCTFLIHRWGSHLEIREEVRESSLPPVLRSPLSASRRLQVALLPRNPRVKPSSVSVTPVRAVDSV